MISFASPPRFETDALLFADPEFMRPSGRDGIPGTLDDNLHVLNTSIVTDAGSNELIARDVVDLDQDGDTDETVPIDLDGFLRIASLGQDMPRVDMGAYESGRVAVSVEPRDFGVRPVMESCPISYLYPNPMRGQIHIGIRGALRGISDLLLFDALGRTVMGVRVDHSSSDKLLDRAIDLSTLIPGAYWIRFRTTDSRRSCYREILRVN